MKHHRNTLLFSILVSTLFLFARLDFAAQDSVSEPLRLVYVCELPPGLPKTVDLHHKGGQLEKADAYDIYKRYHKEGWDFVVEHYRSKGNLTYELVPRAEFGIHTLSRNIGALEAETALTKLELVYGKDRLLEYLRDAKNKP